MACVMVCPDCENTLNTCVCGAPVPFAVHAVVAANAEGKMPVMDPAPLPPLVAVLPGAAGLYGGSGDLLPSCVPDLLFSMNLVESDAVMNYLGSSGYIPTDAGYCKLFYEVFDTTMYSIVDGANFIAQVCGDIKVSNRSWDYPKVLIAASEMLVLLMLEARAVRGFHNLPTHVFMTFMSDQRVWPRDHGLPYGMTNRNASGFMLDMARLGLFPFTVTIITLDKGCWDKSIRDKSKEFDDSLTMALAIDLGARARERGASDYDEALTLLSTDKYDWSKKPAMTTHNVYGFARLDFVSPDGMWFRNDGYPINWDLDWTLWSAPSRAAYVARVSANIDWLKNHAPAVWRQYRP